MIDRSTIITQAGKFLAKMTPYKIVALGLMIATFALLMGIYLSLKAPRLGITFQIDESAQAGAQVRIHTQDSPSNTYTIRALSVPGLDTIPITPFVLLEEPDILDFVEFNQFIQQQDRLHRLLQQHRVDLLLTNGDKLSIQPYHGHYDDLPILFWLQAFYCLSAFLIALTIWSFRRNRIEVLWLMLVGASYAMGGMATAVYSTRELAMDGGTFLILTLVSHFGVYLFMAFLIALLCIFPNRLFGDRLIPFLSIAAAVIALWLHSQQWVDFYLMFVGFFVVVIWLLFLQWRNSRTKLLERASMLWFLLSIGISTGFFFSLVMLPALMGHQPLMGSQGSMLIFIWLMFIGITLGVARYRLFDLGRWWFYAWLWFIGGASVIVIDLALLYLWSVPQSTALPISLVLIGWLYFPLRQWLASRFIHQYSLDERDYLPMIIDHLLSGHQNRSNSSQAWPGLLGEIFSPLQLSAHPNKCDGVQLVDNGVCMEVPGLDKDLTIKLSYANQGSRLFTEADRKLVDSLLPIMQHTWQVIQARKEGVHQERYRIKRELHDGLGAKLQAILHGNGHRNEVDIIAREAWRELRDIINALDGTERLLSDMAGIWRADMKRITNRLQIELDWQIRFEKDIVLPALVSLHLTRILSEGVQNALRHAELNQLSITITQQENWLALSLTNDGARIHQNKWVMGRGMNNIKERVREMGGGVRWLTPKPGHIILEIELPLPA